MKLAFSRASALRTHLLEQLEATRGASRPVRRVGRDGEAPVWAWLPELVRQRSDWLPLVGHVLRDLALADDPWAHTALADVLCGSLHSAALYPYLADFEPRLGAVVATQSGHNWGFNGPRTVSNVLEAQRALVDLAAQPGRPAWLEGEWGPKVSKVPLDTVEDLDAALRLSARRGRFTWTPWGERSWSWIYFEQLGRPWMGPELSRLLPRMLQGSLAEVVATLDWLLEQRDLWRVADALQGVVDAPPWWVDEAIAAHPKGWRKPWPHAPTFAGARLGDVATFLLPLARDQAACPPVMDLPEIGAA